MKQINMKNPLFLIVSIFLISLNHLLIFIVRKKKKIFDSMKVFIIRYYEKRFKSGIKVNSLVLPTRQFYEK